jgi:hypothetical protein
VEIGQSMDQVVLHRELKETYTENFIGLYLNWSIPWMITEHDETRGLPVCGPFNKAEKTPESSGNL